ncbi:MAG: GNAT family N-acetyltransferase, partial [bacterium]
MKVKTESKSDIQIRLAVVDEAESIASVLHQAFAEYETLYTPKALAATALTADQILKRWNEGPVWVALQHDTLVGTVAAVPKGEALYIRSMAILPTGRGQGIGRLLLQQIERFAHEQNYRRLFLSTTPFLSRAIRLYEQFGFQRRSDGPYELFGTPLFTMVKPLNS